MDILKRSLANITDKAWDEIDLQASKVIKANLSARKFMDVKGPLGLDYAAVSLGKLSVPEAQKESGVNYGIRQVLPLVETRMFFELDTWELDDVERGSENPDLSALEKAAAQIARFEEGVIYNGLEGSGICGLSSAAQNNVVNGTANNLMDALSKAILKFGEDSVEGPYTLVAGKSLWQMIQSSGEGYPLKKRVESLMDGGIILSPAVDCNYIVSTRGGDMEITVGQDYSIGYCSSTVDKVKLFVTESFTFRVINPEAVIKLTLGN